MPDTLTKKPALNDGWEPMPNDAAQSGDGWEPMPAASAQTGDGWEPMPEQGTPEAEASAGTGPVVSTDGWELMTPPAPAQSVDEVLGIGPVDGMVGRQVQADQAAQDARMGFTPIVADEQAAPDLNAGVKPSDIAMSPVKDNQENVAESTIEEAAKQGVNAAASVAAGVTRMGRGVAQLVTDMAIRRPPSIGQLRPGPLDEPTKLETWSADQTEQTAQEMAKAGGMPAEVAYRIAQGIGEQFASTAMTLGAAGGLGKAGEGASALQGLTGTIKAAIPQAAKFGGLVYATTPGDQVDRAAAAAHAFALATTGSVAGWIPNSTLRSVAALGMNAGMNSGAYAEAYNQAEELTRQNGGSLAANLAATMTPLALMDILFAAVTPNLRAEQAKVREQVATAAMEQSRKAAYDSEAARRQEELKRQAAIAEQIAQPPRAAITQETLAARVKEGGLEGEVRNLLADLEEAGNRAKDGGAGLAPLMDERGNRLGWVDQGRVYPEGTNGDTARALQLLMEGKPLTEKQLSDAEAAIRVIEKRVDEARFAEDNGPASAKATEGHATDAAGWRDLGDSFAAKANEDGTFDYRMDDGTVVKVEKGTELHGNLLQEFGMANPEVRQAAEAAAAKLPGAKMRLIDDESQLPEDVPFSRDQTGTAQGMAVMENGKPTGEFYVLTKNIKSAADAERVVVHEAVGHIGVRAVLRERIDTVLDGIFKGRSTSGEMQEVAKRWKLDLKTVEGRREAAEEVIARIAERREKEPGPWNRFVAAFRDALRRAGFDRWMDWTDNDIAALVERARSRVSRPEGARAGDVAAAGNTSDIRRSAGMTPQERRRQMIEQAKALREEQNLVMRGTAERIAMRPAMGQAGIENRPASYREPLTIADRAAQHVEMSDADLESAWRQEDNPWRGLDVAERYNRLENAYQAAKQAGDVSRESRLKEQLGTLVDEIGQRGTDAALFMRFIQEIKGSRPEFVVDSLDRTWGKAGLRMTEQQRQKLTALARDGIRTTQARAGALKAMQEAPTRDTIDAFKAADAEWKKAQGALGREITVLTPKKLTDMIRAFRQGNLIVPTSHENNISGNLIMGGVDFGAQNIWALVNRLANVASGGRMPLYQRMINPVDRIRGMGRGLKEGIRALREGGTPGESSKLDEIDTRSFHPIRAWGQAFTSAASPDMLVDAKTGKVRLSDRFKKILEGTEGAYAELTFRMLQAEDAPGRSSRYDATLRELGKAKGLKGEALEAFMLAPDRETLGIALAEADVATYQQSGILTSLVQYARRYVRENPVFDWADALVFHTITPFVKTPWNVFVTAMKLQNPMWALASGTMHAGIAAKAGVDAARAEQAGKMDKARALRGKQSLYARKAGQNAVGLAALGAMMNTAAGILIAGGAVRSAPSRDDEKKRAFQYALGKPGSLNTTALRRFVASGFKDVTTLAPQDGDVWRNLGAFGFFGVNALTLARKEEKAIETGAKPPDDMMSRWAESAGKSLGEVGRAAMDMTFLQGTDQLLRAIDRGNFDEWLNGYARTVVGGVIPGVVRQGNLTRQDAIPDMKTNGMAQAFRNALSANNPFIDWSEAYPQKLDPLGYEVKRTPEGAPEFYYHMLDVGKAQELSDPPAEWREIGRVYGHTLDKRVLPGEPDRSFKYTIQEGPQAGRVVAIELDPRQYHDYKAAIGKARREMMGYAMRDSSYAMSTWTGRAEILDKMLRKGTEIGSRRWVEAEKQKAGDFVKKIREAKANQPKSNETYRLMTGTDL